MNYRKLFAASIVSIGFLAACSDEETKTSQPETKVEQVEPAAKQVIEPDEKGTVEEGGYIKYRGAEWSGEENGLAVTVNSVSLTEDMSIPYPEYEHTVGMPGAMVWVSYENKAAEQRNFDVQNAAIVLEDGTEVDGDFNLTGFLFDEVRPGSKRDADVAFILPAGTDIRAIKSFRFYFGIGAGDDYLDVTEVEAPLQLQ